MFPFDMQPSPDGNHWVLRVGWFGMVSIERANGVSRIRRTLGTYGAYDPLIWAEVKKNKRL